MNINFLKKDGDYEVAEKLFNFINSHHELQSPYDIEFIIYGVDDNTEDPTMTRSYGHEIIGYSDRFDKRTVIRNFINSMHVMVPHAVKWCGEILMGWISRENDFKLVIEELKQTSVETQSIAR